MNKKTDFEKTKKSCIDYYDYSSEEYYEKYADELEKKPYDKEFLTRFIKQIRNEGEVLDIGCASTAQQARFFKTNGFHATAIDLSQKCIETCKKHFPGIEFRQMDMLEMSFDDKSFDAINSFYSIIHIPNEKLNGLFNDFNRLLKPEGKLAIAVHAGDFYGFYDENEIPVFYRTYTQDELTGILNKYGFNIIEIEQRKPIYDFEFQSERIYLIAEKISSC